MVRSRLGLKALGLCALVLGLMAFVTSAAQAEKGASWKVNGATVTSLLPELAVVEIEKLLGNPLDETKHGVLGLTTKGGTKVEFLCTSLTLPAIKLGPEGSVDLGKVIFHGCITKLNGVTSGPCLPHSGATNDLIETLNGVGLIILHNGTPLTRIVPDPVPDPTNKVLAHIQLGEECAIGTEVLVTGQLTLKDSGSFTTEAVEHLIEPGPLTELFALGVNATLNGSAKVKLTGAHNGLKWSGVPA
jgi:hypothetical protein